MNSSPDNGGGMAQGKGHRKRAAMTSRGGFEKTSTAICKITYEREDWTGQSTGIKKQTRRMIWQTRASTKTMAV